MYGKTEINKARFWPWFTRHWLRVSP